MEKAVLNCALIELFNLFLETFIHNPILNVSIDLIFRDYGITYSFETENNTQRLVFSNLDEINEETIFRLIIAFHSFSCVNIYDFVDTFNNKILINIGIRLNVYIDDKSCLAYDFVDIKSITYTYNIGGMLKRKQVILDINTKSLVCYDTQTEKCDKGMYQIFNILFVFNPYFFDIVKFRIDGKIIFECEINEMFANVGTYFTNNNISEWSFSFLNCIREEDKYIFGIRYLYLRYISLPIQRTQILPDIGEVIKRIPHIRFTEYDHNKIVKQETSNTLSTA